MADMERERERERERESNDTSSDNTDSKIMMTTSWSVLTEF